ncbi:MAG: DegT/DnrJ/EryC1/StrS family aminotransferase [Spirochaeta sp.]|jgi:perosamine synthetase|nr:DegT/DnrJ/EryC1/StrS family aminotransferase [Spirochaeta sp.]
MIPIFRPTIRRADMDAVLTRLAEDSIGAGTVSKEFSHSLAKYVGKRSGISLRSYGHALLAAFRALDLEQGARVGLSALAPVSVYNMIAQAGLEPVLVDTDRQLPVVPSPLNFDYEALSLSALYVGSRLGYVADMENLGHLRIPIIEDISEGLGGHTGTAGLGSFGDMTVVAMEPEHIITAGGGAVVLTSNTRRVSALTALVDERIGEPPLPDMNAALGITQLKQLESFIERRRDIAARFVKTVQRGKYRVPLQGGEGDNVFFALPVMVDGSPREVEKYARSHGVTARRAFNDVAFSSGSLQDGIPSADASGAETETDGEGAGSPYPNALAFASQMVAFPLFPTLGKAEQEQIERVLATLP